MHLRRRFPPGFTRREAEVEQFLFERLRGVLVDLGYGAREVDAVLSLRPGASTASARAWPRCARSWRCPRHRAWRRPTSASPTCSRRARPRPPARPGAGSIDNALLLEPAEQALAQAYAAVVPAVAAAEAAGDDTGVLRALAPLRTPVDRFFDDVMVLVDEPALRANRLALLAHLRALMNRIADIALLAAG